MKVLNLGLDKSILDKASSLPGRTVEYGDLVEKYTVIVPSQKNEKIELSKKVIIYGSGGGNKLAQLFYVYKKAKKLLAEETSDAITVQDQYFLALIGACLAKKYRIGLEIQVHGFEKYYGLRKLIAGYVLPRADAVRCVSQRLKKQLINDLGVKEEKITVAPIFVDTDLSLRGAGRRGNLVPGNFIFLTVGRLVPVKNINLQIEAMAEIIKKYPQVKLWVVGGGPERDNLKFKIEKLKLVDSVNLLNQKTKEELNQIYSQIDAFMLTSDSEGWGLAVIEAASWGLPIIMTDVGCAGEVIKNNESGLVVPVGDKQKLTEAILKILEDENLRKKLGENAKLAVNRLPNKEQTLELYKKSWEIAITRKL